MIGQPAHTNVQGKQETAEFDFSAYLMHTIFDRQSRADVTMSQYYMIAGLVT